MLASVSVACRSSRGGLSLAASGVLVAAALSVAGSVISGVDDADVIRAASDCVVIVELLPSA